MHEEGMQKHVQIAMSVEHPLKDETQHGHPPGPGLRSPPFALLIQLRRLRISSALLYRQVYGVGCFLQSLPMPSFVVVIQGRQLGERTSRAKLDRCDLDPMAIPGLLHLEVQHLGRGENPWNSLGFRRRSVGSWSRVCWKDVPLWPCQVLEKGVHVQLRQARRAYTTGRTRVYVVVGPGYPIAVSRKPLSARYLGRDQTVVLSWRKQGILGFPRVAGHGDLSIDIL